MATSVSTPGPAAPEDALRFTFVEMLFALAVSQVAMSAADLASLREITWEASPAISHLTLCLAVIATSWVGWRRSQAPGTKPPITSIFHLRFVELLIDVVLVIVYFILVKSVEIEQVYGSPTPRLAPQPSATPEAEWISFIFGVYVVWDLIVDVLSADCLARPASVTGPDFWKKWAVVGVSTCSSLACLVLSLLVAWRSQYAASVPTICLFDAALLSIVLLFRVLKTIELPLSRRLGIKEYKAFSSGRPLQTGSESNDLKVIAGLLLAYAFCFAMACCYNQI